MEIIFSAVIGYILGSIPTAYLIVRMIHNKDVTKEGSGNVGALNSLQVSSSKITGLIVLLIDISKGVASVLIVQLLFGNLFIYGAIGLTSAVFSHCYSPWLGFKGGRGLATAAGGFLFLAPSIMILWLIFWVVSFLFKKHNHFSNITATVLTTVIIWTSTDILNSTAWYTFHPAETSLQFRIIFSLLMIVILSRHIESIKEYFKIGMKKNRGVDDE